MEVKISESIIHYSNNPISGSVVSLLLAEITFSESSSQIRCDRIPAPILTIQHWMVCTCENGSASQVTI